MDTTCRSPKHKTVWWQTSEPVQKLIRKVILPLLTQKNQYFNTTFQSQSVLGKTPVSNITTVAIWAPFLLLLLLLLHAFIFSSGGGFLWKPIKPGTPRRPVIPVKTNLALFLLLLRSQRYALLKEFMFEPDRFFLVWIGSIFSPPKSTTCPQVPPRRL